MEELKKLISSAQKKGASDLHLVAGERPFLRIKDELSCVKGQPLAPRTVEKMASSLLKQDQLKELADTGDVDTGAIIGNVSVRINIHRQTNGLGMAIRLLPAVIPSPEALGFSGEMLEIPSIKGGLVLVSGAAGSGKSTTLAAIIEVMNHTAPKHIITLEDPIEYRFENKQCLIEQRQLGSDFPTFAKGLRHVLRQDPDVIVVGEMRDPETIELALTAAETGHLVLSTLHAPNASEVVERIVTIFEGAKQNQILVQFAACMKMIITQQLVQNKSGELVAAREILTSTPAVQNAIRQNNLGTIQSAIQTGKKFGMISMDRSLKELGLA
jgi:twitching motility protein PilT